MTIYFLPLAKMKIGHMCRLYIILVYCLVVDINYFAVMSVMKIFLALSVDNFQ